MSEEDEEVVEEGYPMPIPMPMPMPVPILPPVCGPLAKWPIREPDLERANPGAALPLLLTMELEEEEDVEVDEALESGLEEFVLALPL